MATEFNRPSQRTVDSHNQMVGSGLGIVVGIVAALAIGALVFFTFIDRAPTGPTTVKSPTVTKTVPPANTTPAPTTK